MTPESPVCRSTRGEELANSITHGLGAVLATVGLVTLLLHAALAGSGWLLVSCSIFGASLLLLYLASTLYHAIPHPRVKPILRIVDHSAILLLIAGTYTPFTLVSLRGPWGWSLFAIIWSLALVGIVLEVTRLRRFRAALIALYVLMGWTVVVAIKPMLASIGAGGLWLLAGGGLAYTGGLVFYLWRRLPYNHAIWHLFVLAGSAQHYLAVLWYVVAPAASAR